MVAPPTKGWAPAPDQRPGVVTPVVVSEQSHRPMVTTPDQGPGVVALVVVSEQSHRPMVAAPDLDHCPRSTFEMLDALSSSPRSMS